MRAADRPVRFLDTNVFIRYLVADDPDKSAASHALLQRVQQSWETLTCTEAIIAEVVYVLASPRLYHLSHPEIRARLYPILTLRGLQIEHKETLLRALDLYAAHAFLDYEDALTVAHMERRNIETIVSYDTDFDRIAGISRQEP